MSGGRRPGSPKTGGRKKGSLNVDRQHLYELALSYGLDPFQALCRIATDESSLHQFAALKEVADRIIPKLRMVEVTGKEGAPLIPAAQPRSAEELAELCVKVREAMQIKGKT